MSKNPEFTYAEAIAEHRPEVVRAAKPTASRFSRFVTAIAAVVAWASAPAAFATGTTITLPDNGVDESGFITAVIADFGAVAAVVIGGYMTYLIVRKAMAWAGKAVR